MIKNLLSIMILSGMTVTCFASPSYEVVNTCINTEPYKHKSTIERLEGGGYEEKILEGCEDQFDLLLNGFRYGSVRCNDKFYLIIRDKKIDPAKAENNSINPQIKPGVEFSIRSLWYKIGFENKEYLCIYAPLSEQGAGASRNQYYIIENAFDARLDPKLYFYFFDKDIAPVFNESF